MGHGTMAKSTEWNPIQELAGMQRRMNKLFEAALARTDFDAEGSVGVWVPPADVFETADSVRVYIELPGLGQDHIRVRVERDELVVEGERPMEREQPGERFHRVERSYGQFSRRFRLPADTDLGSVAASYRNGVLEISLGRAAGSEPRSIPVAIR